MAGGRSGRGRDVQREGESEVPYLKSPQKRDPFEETLTEAYKIHVPSSVS